jgi:hypothetical protein
VEPALYVEAPSSTVEGLQQGQSRTAVRGVNWKWEELPNRFSNQWKIYSVCGRVNLANFHGERDLFYHGGVGLGRQDSSLPPAPRGVLDKSWRHQLANFISQHLSCDFLIQTSDDRCRRTSLALVSAEGVSFRTGSVISGCRMQNQTPDASTLIEFTCPCP